jgi:hypothetical protein
MGMGTSLRSYSRGHTLVSMQDGVANATRYYHFDHQGTTQCLTNEAGVVTDRFASDAWGVEVKRTGSSINRHWYIGNGGYYSHDARTYVRNRHFEQHTARWLSMDPLASSLARRSGRALYLGQYRAIGVDALRRLVANPERLARYSYCAESPSRESDPSGLLGISPSCTYGRAAAEGFAAEARLFCNKLNAMTVGQRMAAEGCFYSIATKNGTACDFNILFSNPCLLKACNGALLQLACDNTCRNPACEDLCATSSRCSSGTGTILFCTDNLWSKPCGDRGGDRSLDHVQFVLAHELFHCCGAGGHGAPDPPGWRQCQSIAACCLLNAMVQVGPPNFKACERKEPA